MLERQIFKLESTRVLVIDEVIDHDLAVGFITGLLFSALDVYASLN